MSYLCCTSNLVVNEDQTATITTELCNVCCKTINACFTDPGEWVNMLIKNSIESKARSIYQHQLENHITNGTMPVDATKGSLILSYEHDPTKPLPP